MPIREVVVVVVLTGAYTGYVEPEVSVTAKQERPPPHVWEGYWWDNLR